MAKSELIALCKNFKPGDKANFQKIISAFITMDKNNEMELTREFEVAISTVRRWITGIATPHPLVQNKIVREIILIAKRGENG
ncbi:MAG: hypothetical protein V1661_03155 [bacterium]